MILDKNNLTAKNKTRFGQTRSIFFSSFTEEAGFDPMQGCGGSLLAGETKATAAYACRRRPRALWGRKAVSRRRFGGEKPGLYAGPAPQRVHVKDRKTGGEQTAQMAAAECDEDRARECKLDGPLFDHVHTVVFQRAVLGAFLTAIPSLGARKEPQRDVLRHVVADRIARGDRFGRARELAQATCIEAAPAGGGLDVAEITASTRRRMAVEFRM